jgi:hypothetical protein
MNKTQLKQLASDRLSLLLANNPPVAGVIVTLVEYRSESDYKSVVLDPVELTWAEHRQCMGYLAEMLTALEARPVFVAIEPRKYFRWLKKNGVTNTIGQRSVYAAEVYSGGTVSKGRVFEAEDL